MVVHPKLCLLVAETISCSFSTERIKWGLWFMLYPTRYVHNLLCFFMLVTSLVIAHFPCSFEPNIIPVKDRVCVIDDISQHEKYTENSSRRKDAEHAHHITSWERSIFWLVENNTKRYQQTKSIFILKGLSKKTHLRYLNFVSNLGYWWFNLCSY